MANAIRLANSVGCPACEAEATVVDRWYRAFEREKSSDVFTVRSLSAALGPCPEHTLRWLDSSLGRELSVVSYSAIVSTARRKLAAGDPTRARCPVCAVADEAGRGVVETLERGLADGTVRRAYVEAAGLCPRHLSLAIREAPAQLEALVDRAACALENAQFSALVALLTSGPRLPRPVSRGMADEPRVEQRTSGRLEQELSVGGCILCRAAVDAEVRVVGSILATHGAPDARADEVSLCASHLGWLAELDPDAAIRVAEAARASWLESLGAVPAENPPRRPCPVCAAGGAAATRRYEALSRAVGDPRVASAIIEGAGLCVLHAAKPPGEPCPQRILNALAVRLAIVGWELEELWRFGDWTQRWDQHGAELGANLRAARLLDGRLVLVGLSGGP